MTFYIHFTYQVKDILITSPVLALFDPSLETIVSADASSFGLGAVLMQRQMSGEQKPVAYILRSKLSTEQYYAQIEKEELAFTWACEHFSGYIIGLKFHIETYHKPLVPLFSTKNLDELPARVQRFRLCMLVLTSAFPMCWQEFDYSRRFVESSYGKA